LERSRFGKINRSFWKPRNLFTKRFLGAEGSILEKKIIKKLYPHRLMFIEPEGRKRNTLPLLLFAFLLPSFALILIFKAIYRVFRK
jgi:hypothetical protein